MKTLLKNFFIAIILFPSVAFTQDQGIFQRLHSQKIENYLLIRLDDSGKFSYHYTKENKEFTPFSTSAYFNVKNKDFNNCKIFFQFYNPLRFNIKSSMTDTEDPMYKIYMDFFSKLPAGIIDSPIKFDEETNKQNNLISNKMNGEENSQKANFTDLINPNILLYQWTYEFIGNIDTSKIKEDSKFSELIELINKIPELDNYFYSEIAIGDEGNKKSIDKWSQSIKDELYSADSLESFKRILENDKKLVKELKTMDSTLFKTSDQIINLLTKSYDSNVAPYILPDSAFPSYFKNYSAVSASVFKVSRDPLFAKNREIIKNLEEFIQKLSDFSKQFKGVTIGPDNIKILKEYRKDYNFTLKWDDKNLRQFEYSCTPIDNKGNEIKKDEKTASFSVAKKLLFYPSISTGVIIPINLSYPNYAIALENGNNTISKVNDANVYVRPAVFLNLFFIDWEPVLPFAQIGFSSGVGDLIMPIGAGFSLARNLTISGGMLLARFNDLTNLKVGDIVKDQAALETDLSKKTVLRLYASINYTIGK